MDKFKLAIESHYLNDVGTTENALNMPEKELKKREIIFVDVAKKGNEKLPADEVPLNVRLDGRMWQFITAKSGTSAPSPPSGTKQPVGAGAAVDHRSGNVLLQEGYDSISLNRSALRP